ncbi:MAG: XshC-Cox1-family protein [Desulfovibrionaceae bacterium CG1_02_65_16]|nr:MAG: XshC-Cox1-family protein [Desulfovibrionaceae bacterium CG1_02_65_16]
MNDILAPLISALQQGKTVIRATILTQEGSTPRSAGSRMVLEPDGNSNVRITAGTVGGGLVEARVMERAARMLAGGEADRRAVESFDLTGELAAGADMICGGRLRVFLERLSAPALPLFRELAARVDAGERLLLLTPLGQGEASLLPRSGGVIGERAPDDLARAAREQGAGLDAPVILTHGGRDYALEPYAGASPLYIFGAGHVSRPTAAIAAMLDFRVTVLDDRPEFANAQRFPDVETRVLTDFSACLAGLTCGPEACIVIVTRGHANDADVLAQVLRTQAGYIGMIGSRRKREAVYERMRARGYTDADLARVHCPIGLAIGAETPEEIAVSINAELIACRSATRAAASVGEHSA